MSLFLQCNKYEEIIQGLIIYTLFWMVNFIIEEMNNAIVSKNIIKYYKML